jgi:tRNA (Thr-GGU) A37 N-methylase
VTAGSIVDAYQIEAVGGTPIVDVKPVLTGER